MSPRAVPRDDAGAVAVVLALAPPARMGMGALPVDAAFGVTRLVR